jgi:hypothetical protein
MYVVCPYTDLQWPRGLRRRSAVDCWGFRVRIPSATWVSFCYECRVLSGRGFCAAAIHRPKEFYRLWCVWVWSWNLDNEGVLVHWRLLRHGEKISVFVELFKILPQSSSDFRVALYRQLTILQGYYEFKTFSSHYTCGILTVGYKKPVSGDICQLNFQTFAISGCHKVTIQRLRWSRG